MLSAYATFGALALAAGTLAQAQSQGTADPLQIALVEAQFNASGLDAPIGNSQSLNIPLEAEGLLNVTYSNFTVQNGNAYPAGQVNTKPRLTVTPAQGAAWSGNYTVILADFSALGNPDAEGDYRHYLANNVQASSVGLLSNGTVITYYAGPGPIEGTGAHRYSWLIFQQPSTFAAPANLSTSGVAPGHWSVQQYVQSSGLGKLVAASFFTVENGAPTASAVQTTAVNTATLSIPSTATTSGGATQGANANANNNKDNNGAASSSYAVSGVAAFAVAGLVAILA